jgi:hypothetical protein
LVRPDGEVYEPVRLVAQRREVRGGKHLLEAERRAAVITNCSLALDVFVGTWRNNLYFRCLSTADACQQQERDADRDHGGTGWSDFHGNLSFRGENMEDRGSESSH